MTFESGMTEGHVLTANSRIWDIQDAVQESGERFEIMSEDNFTVFAVKLALCQPQTRLSCKQCWPDVHKLADFG